MIFCLWIHAIYYLVDIGSLIRMPCKGCSYTLTPLLPSQVQPIHKLNGEGNTSEEALLLSEAWVERSLNKSKIVLALFVLQKGEGETPVHPLAQPLIHEFKDVFPDD